MVIETLNTILHIRYFICSTHIFLILRRENKCCHRYEVPAVCLKKIGTSQSYIGLPAEEDILDEIDNFSKILI